MTTDRCAAFPAGMPSTVDAVELRPMTPEQIEREAGRAAYWRERDMALDHDHCFLCGVHLTDEQGTDAYRTDEHVFPKWMQRDFDLWNQELNLLNGTTIRYRSLTIPCCKKCNGFWLSQVEDRVSRAFRAGADAVKALDPTVLGLWMGKIYYGIHFKELALPADPRNPQGPTIVPPAQLARFSELHHVLQAMRQRARFERAPASVRVFRAQVPENRQHRFDYRDVRPVPYLAIRARESVVIASLIDWGAMNDGISAPSFEAAEQIELHPTQFAEVAAFGAYVAMKFNREFGYLIKHEGDHDVIEPVIIEEHGGADPDRPVFDPFDPGEMANILAEFTGFSVEDIYDPAGQRLWTNLRNADGTPAVVTLEQAPIGVGVVPPTWKGVRAS